MITGKKQKTKDFDFISKVEPSARFFFCNKKLFVIEGRSHVVSKANIQFCNKEQRKDRKQLELKEESSQRQTFERFFMLSFKSLISRLVASAERLTTLQVSDQPFLAFLDPHQAQAVESKNDDQFGILSEKGYRYLLYFIWNIFCIREFLFCSSVNPWSELMS